VNRVVLSILTIVITLAGCYSPPVLPGTEAVSGDDTREDEDEAEDLVEFEFLPVDSELPVSSFAETWAYVLDGREQSLKIGYPLSDLGYFGAELDSYGKLVNVPNPRKLAKYSGRVHLVVASNGRALTHFALAQGSKEREQLIADLLKAADPYDGLQIDFENVPARDGEVFLSFLSELRAGLGDKIFSIALPARSRTIRDDVYDYQKILPLVDRILVMAYDEHWSTSAPGPIASMNWCRRVAAYSLETIGREKLIMGLPFYGRSWGNINPNRAFLYSGIEELIEKQDISEIDRENGIPTFRYEVPLSVTVYYEDDYSLSARLEMYRAMGVASVGFWRLGQETPAIWSLLRLDGEEE
jgi:spore germination protein YaaH